VKIEWEHNKTFGDWTLSIPMPKNSRIRGVISYTCPRPDDHTVWGTVESIVAEVHILDVEKYENPSMGVDAVGQAIIGLMSEIIIRLSTSI